MRGTTPGGGSVPSRTQAESAVSSARIVQMYGFGLGCCWQRPNGGLVTSGSDEGAC